MNLGMLGFLAGASKTALDSIQSRENDEREIKKAKMMEQMKLETAKYLANFDDLLASKHPDNAMTEIDYEKGTETLKNRDGKVLSVGQLSQAKKEEHDLGLRKEESGLAKDAASIRSLDASAASSYSSQRLQDRTDPNIRSGGSSSKAPTDAERADALFYLNRDMVKEAGQTDGINPTAPRILAAQTIAAAKAAQRAGVDFDPNSHFALGMENLIAQARTVDRSKVVPSWMTPLPSKHKKN